jgi:hypothetical protein
MVRWTIDVIVRGIVVALGGFAGSIIGGMLMRALALPPTTLPAGAQPTQLLLMSGAGALLVSLLLFPLARRLSVPLAERLAILFIAIWGIQGVLTESEAYFFTSYGGAAAQLVHSAATCLALALLLAILFPPKSSDRRLLSEVRTWLVSRPLLSWLGRVLLAGVLFLPTYWIFGMLAYSITHSYYENTGLGLGLRVPPVGVIVPLEIGRGLLFVLMLLPIVVVLRSSRWSLVGWLWLVLALLTGWEPLLTATFLPGVVRLVHGLEITADSLAQAMTIAVLLGPRVVVPATTARVTRISTSPDIAQVAKPRPANPDPMAKSA